MPMPSPNVLASSPASAVSPQVVHSALEVLFREELEREGPLRADADLVTELALDSMELTVLAVGLENRFRIRLREEDTFGVQTVGDLVALVVQRCAAEPSR
jgi:acyl carrier protein